MGNVLSKEKTEVKMRVAVSDLCFRTPAKKGVKILPRGSNIDKEMKDDNIAAGRTGDKLSTDRESHF